MRTGWIILAVIAVVVFGLLSGITGMLIAPIAGGLVLVAIIVWLLNRKAKHEPPMD